MEVRTLVVFWIYEKYHGISDISNLTMWRWLVDGRRFSIATKYKSKNSIPFLQRVVPTSILRVLVDFCSVNWSAIRNMMRRRKRPDCISKSSLWNVCEPQLFRSKRSIFLITFSLLNSKLSKFHEVMHHFNLCKRKFMFVSIARQWQCTESA